MAFTVETYLRWSSGRKALIWFSVGLVIVGVYWGTAFRKSMSSLSAIQEAYAKEDASLREKQAVAANLPVVKEAVKQLDLHLEKALEKLPGSEEIPSLLKTVSDLGVESGLESVLFRPGVAKPVGPKYFYAEVPFTMEYAGQYHDLGVFFDKIANLPRIVAIDSFYVDTDHYGMQGEPVLKMKIEARTFRFLPPEERPKDDPKKAKTAAKAGKK
jgi:type IV pilus assembly protein PilO